MRAFTNNKIIKSLLIPSEDELIKKFPHISQVHIIFVRKIMAPLASIILPEKKIFMWLWPCFYCIYTIDEHESVLNRPSAKYDLHYVNILPKTYLARQECCWFEPF